MFTGLIQDVAGVIDVIRQGETLRLVLATRLPAARFELGASVACNGVCLTVVAFHEVPATGETLLEFDAGPETLRVTQLETLRKGDAVNLEPALRVGDAIGGHDVTGHVDTCLAVHAFAPWDGGFWRLELAVPPSQSRYCIPKGSIALRGVSLTLADVQRQGDGSVLCGLMLVPHTLSQTNLSTCVQGMRIEVEFDRNVKTVATLLELMVPHLLPQNPTR